MATELNWPAVGEADWSDEVIANVEAVRDVADAAAAAVADIEGVVLDPEALDAVIGPLANSPGTALNAAIEELIATPVLDDNSIAQSKVIGLTDLATDVAELQAVTSGGNTYTIDYDYDLETWPLRDSVYGVLPPAAVVNWRGPAADPPPVTAGYAQAQDSFELTDDS